jgi:hypothetical protein
VSQSEKAENERKIEARKAGNSRFLKNTAFFLLFSMIYLLLFEICHIFAANYCRLLFGW